MSHISCCAVTGRVLQWVVSKGVPTNEETRFDSSPRDCCSLFGIGLGTRNDVHDRLDRHCSLLHDARWIEQLRRLKGTRMALQLGALRDALLDAGASPAKAAQAAVVGSPATSMLSLTTNGTP